MDRPLSQIVFNAMPSIVNSAAQVHLLQGSIACYSCPAVRGAWALGLLNGAYMIQAEMK